MNVKPLYVALGVALIGLDGSPRASGLIHYSHGAMANHFFLPKNSGQQEELGSFPIPDIVKSVLERDCLGQQAFPGEEGGNFRGALQLVRAANTVTLLWFLAKPRSLAF